MSAINPSSGSSDPYDDLTFYKLTDDNSDQNVDDPTDPRSPNYDPLLAEQAIARAANPTSVTDVTNPSTPTTNDDKINSTSTCVEDVGKQQNRSRRHMKEAADLQQAIINSLQQNEDIQKDKNSK